MAKFHPAGVQVRGLAPLKFFIHTCMKMIYFHMKLQSVAIDLQDLNLAHLLELNLVLTGPGKINHVNTNYT